ncbi:MAG: AarF/ABC1/UbiB kinase family protein [Silvanigrellaceae bacterium]|nr:AarF/ABC1/UbiB kinase family protein [Silvanigrellaceae bacterium]
MDHKTRAFSLLKTVGSATLKAGNEALKRKIFSSKENDGSSQNSNDIVSEAALRLVKGLDQLKGAAMKLGQILSMIDEKALPPGWKNALMKLQSEATPQDWSSIEPILLEELGSLDAFTNIETRAIHAASIGQIHRGWLKDGRAVAIKVRYSGIEEGLKSDISSMRKILKLAGMVPNFSNYDSLIPMIEKIFLQEINFVKEKEFYNLYREKFKDDPSFLIPETIDFLCTKKVLVTTWMDGENLQTWIKKQDKNIETPTKSNVAAGLLRLVFTEILDLKYIQSDPNPGNFLISKDGKIILLDFGATLHLDEELSYNYGQLCYWQLKKDRKNVIKYAQKMHFLNENDSKELEDSFLKILGLSLEPFTQESFCWGTHNQMFMRLNSELLTYAKLSNFRPPMPEILFINRRLMGNLLMMDELGASTPAKEILLHLLKDSINSRSSATD